MHAEPAIEISALSHAYGQRQALCDVSLAIGRGEVFALLGPNGGGKTTLFRVLSTLVPHQCGEVRMLGLSLGVDSPAIRGVIGVVFQSPSLDKKLTVAENVRCQGALYGLFGRDLRVRQDELLAQLGLSERAGERAETLSGGLRRRVELAKGMIHRPELLLLDEPSTGLDPGARADLWEYLCRLQGEFGVTVVLTTHLLEEADKADRLAILNEGRLVALDTPDALRASVGGDTITIETADAPGLATEIAARLGGSPAVVDGSVRLSQSDPHQWLARLMETFAGRIEAIRLAKPTLEDVFIAKTGHRFWRERREAGHD